MKDKPQPIKINNYMADLSGERFCNLTALYPARNNKTGMVVWVCSCDCGGETMSPVGSLRSGKTTKCKSCNRDVLTKKVTTHGDSRNGSKIYKSWARMRERCLNANHKDYHLYGGRGISICDEWNDYKSFKRWAIDNGFKDGLTIDRTDNDCGYAPKNCRWSTMKQQANNRRSNVRVTFDGKTRTLSEWGDATGISRFKIANRLNMLAWTVERTLTTP